MLEISHLAFHYKKQNILKDVSLSVGEHECIGIIGGNGCGKSTLLSLLVGARKPHQGTISSTIPGKTIKDFMGYVPQDNPLIPGLSGYDNLLLWYKGKKKDLKKELESPAIKMLGIDSFLKKDVEKLSGGMKKRLSIAIALINHPSLLILDEPSAALDLPCKADIARYLKAYHDDGGSIILVTHEEAELNICTKVFILKDGRLVPTDPAIRGEALVKELTV
ncbi:MAG: ABC transporter ATP-binding protein [Lachnospiraceae bacterium]|nr:ABC transporter ATP-binding protein [Lachnospiraceae bacterium]